MRESTQSERELAREYHLNRATVRKWRRRDHGQEASHRPQRLHTTLTPAQEWVVIELRTTLLLPLDDLLAVTRAFLHPAVSRSGLDRGLRRQGVSHLQALIPPPEDDEQPKKTFKDDEPGFVHVAIKSLPQRPNEAAQRDLFVAIDRASRPGELIADLDRLASGEALATNHVEATPSSMRRKGLSA